MIESTETKAFNLIKELNKEGGKIYYEDKEIYIKYPKGIEISADLISKIKLHKPDLISYFEGFSKKENIQSPDQNKIEATKIVHDGEEYYYITPTEKYWVDDNADQEYKEKNKDHGTIKFSYEILGEFDKDVFNKSILFLINRNESLRSTFHKINEKFYMKISNQSILERTEYIDLRGQEISESELKDIRRFNDHKFDLSTGSLILARLIQIEDKKFVISFNIHHVISDIYSKQILLRDFMVTYNSFLQNRQPELPTVKYHLKENLYLINKFIETNADSNRDYWNDLYPNLPDELIIPCTTKVANKDAERIKESKIFDYPVDLFKNMKLIAKKESTSLFVVLQTSFKAYFNHKTNQTDMLFGTYSFGRNFEISENQIGCYAKTVLIRTAFDKKDDFISMVKKVKQSNNDMNDYHAFSLMDSIEKKLVPNQSLTGGFWKVNMQYDDAQGNYLNKSDYQNVVQRPNVEYREIVDDKDPIMAIDMELWFVNSGDNLQLNVVYDSSRYDSLGIENFILDYIDFSSKKLSDIDFNQI
ncbi:condensation domain-containing protein [Flavobacterium sp. 270]|uniref:condensation domain-containing protein n=1 Tax=Flavobacterium sp. 270 TaxID=2512114 RepID=UPI001066F9B1|nr:condensation domain-containing protein [Flavobacterium sp. 270]TDW43366.1 condensation domain-containing protein [Flavobacterium sp. 270]